MTTDTLTPNPLGDISPRFQRSSLLLGAEMQKELENRHITIIGLGAVGSHVAEAVVRFGVGAVRLVDFDIIRETNINRQLFALTSTLGLPKVQAAKNRLLDINPGLSVETFETFCHEETLPLIFRDATDIVVDAIDSYTPKIKLLETLHRREIPVISSMGAAGRTDPTFIRIGDISETSVCPLASRIRKQLRKLGITSGIRCVYSIEPVKKTQVELSHAEGEEEFFKRGRVRRASGSISYLTGIFGYMIAWDILRFFLSR